MYRSILGKGSSGFEIAAVARPIEEAIALKEQGVVPLVLHSATDRVLNERMFADGPRLGQLLMGHLYTPTQGHESPSLYAIGVANTGLELMSGIQMQPNESIIRQMAGRREILGDVLTNNDVADILRSGNVRRIIAHALGPKGTNISQAMKQYVETIGVDSKTDLIVHPAGIEPMAYAAMSLQQVKEGDVPIHMECAVYYDMRNLFDQRPGEVVFADHHYMNLDEMQLASIVEIDKLAEKGVMRIATHPSPKPLIDGWVEAGRAEWVKATSNSAAAQMVVSGEVDACVTTGSGLKEADGLVSRHIFGSPIMLFTIATPLTQRQLQSYR